jgi:hypothetical protein
MVVWDSSQLVVVLAGKSMGYAVMEKTGDRK